MAGEAGRKGEMLDKQKEKEKKESILSKEQKQTELQSFAFPSRLPSQSGLRQEVGDAGGLGMRRGLPREKFEPTQTLILFIPSLCQLILPINPRPELKQGNSLMTVQVC